MFSKEILTDFGLDPDTYTVHPFGSGLIHKTTVVRNREGKNCFILQQVNSDVFRNPEDIASNLNLIGNYLSRHYPDYLFTKPVQTTAHGNYCRVQGNYYRLFEFVADTHTIDTCSAPEQAYAAASAFGEFTFKLSGMRVDMLRHTIPRFHDLSFRWQQFESGVGHAVAERLAKSVELVKDIRDRYALVERYQRIRTDKAFHLRVTHHDTKINNVLFDRQGKGVCVIDLDTVMPGYFISDFGDMCRTYLSPAGEEEKDLDKITIRLPFFEAIVEGYLSFMSKILTNPEKEAVYYAGSCMIYMQALRFLTDYLLGDPYYGARYEEHNFIRAKNQLTLLARYEALQPAFDKIIRKFAGS